MIYILSTKIYPDQTGKKERSRKSLRVWLFNFFLKMINLFNESEQNFTLPVSQQELAVGVHPVAIVIIFAIMVCWPQKAE